VLAVLVFVPAYLFPLQRLVLVTVKGSVPNGT
jgi:hypothetical protein